MELPKQILHVNNNGKPLDEKTIECLNKIVDVVNTKKLLFSTWDEEYPPESTRFIPRLTKEAK